MASQARACKPARAAREARTHRENGLGGRKRWGGARSEEADRTDWTKRISARPGSCRQRHGEWARNRGRDGAGAGRAQNSPLTSHLPARPSLEPGAGPAVLAPPPPRLPSGSRRQCAHGRADTGPTAAHSRARRRHRAPAEHACYSRLGARCPQSLGVVVAWPVFPQASAALSVPISALKPSLPFAGSAFFVSHRNAHSHPRAVLLVCFRSRGREFPIPEALDWLRSFP